jgi:predicted lipoprotein
MPIPNKITIPSGAWTLLPDTDIEVCQSTGANLQLEKGVITNAWMIPPGVTVIIRQATPVVDTNDPYYQEGQTAVRVLLDIAAHTANTILALLARTEQTMVTAHHNKQAERYSRAKGMADAIREYLEALG